MYIIVNANISHIWDIFDGSMVGEWIDYQDIDIDNCLQFEAISDADFYIRHNPILVNQEVKIISINDFIDTPSMLDYTYEKYKNFDHWLS